VVAFLLFACSPVPRDNEERSFGACIDALPRSAEVTGVFVEPDDGLPPVIDEIDTARCGIDVSVYILSNSNVIDALIRAAARGVRVRVMLEQYPFGGGGTQEETMDVLTASGIEVRWSANDVRFSHAKFMVIDRSIAMIMNANLTASAFDDNREFGATTTDEESVSQAQAVFDRDWNHEPVTPSEGPLIVSPTNSRERYLDLISRADESIDFYAEVIRDPGIIGALLQAEYRGVAVRLIVDDSIDEASQESLVTLFEGGVEIRLASGLYIHAKLMVIDNALAVVGSQNFTATSLDLNRELAIVLTDPATLSRCTSVFERDWLRAVPGSPSGYVPKNPAAAGLDRSAVYG
jgi:phosphatidylserine/phosphatidylglycerophosphate/cardiolipin synthase-like enzyme